MALHACRFAGDPAGANPARRRMHQGLLHLPRPSVPTFRDRTETMAFLRGSCGISDALRGSAAARRLRQPPAASATCTFACGSRCRRVPGLPAESAALKLQQQAKSHCFGAYSARSSPLGSGSGGSSVRGRGQLGVARGWRRGRSQSSEPAQNMPGDR